MSDDLISRKSLRDHLFKAIQENGDMDCLDFYRVACLIDAEPMAFDKEKVIEKLKDQYNYSREVRNENDNNYFEYWDGRTDSYKDAIEIVEKGGVE